jgi:heme-degrading monooxygenase HmoA
MKGEKTMYATLLTLNLGPGMRSVAEKLADQFALVIRGMKGFKSQIHFGDETAGEYSSVTIYESKEDAEASMTANRPKLEQAIKDIVKRPPTFKIYEVYEPKT